MIGPPPGAHPDEDAPYVAGPFRWRLGLRPLDLDDWLRVDDGALVEWEHKQHVLARHPQTAMAWLPEVHAPVAQLNAQLEQPIDGFFDRLRPERSWWRLGWGLLATDELYLPLDGTAPPQPVFPEAGDPDAAERLFLRVERETRRRFPHTGAVLFTIGTTVRPLSHLTQRPDDARRLAEALEAFPDDVAAYKGVYALRDVAVKVLG